MSHGGHRPGAGRPRSDLRGLDISDIGIEFDQPVTHVADSISVEKCGVCGAVGWGPYSVTVQALERSDEPDEQGNYFHVLADVQMPGCEIKHRKLCRIEDDRFLMKR